VPPSGAHGSSQASYGWDLVGYHFETQNVTYADQKRWLRKHRLAVVTLGLAAILLCLIPVAQLLFVNTNTAAAGAFSAHFGRRSRPDIKPQAIGSARDPTDWGPCFC
jgi:uncharacterized protein involved in cysteine biosynthesis